MVGKNGYVCLFIILVVGVGRYSFAQNLVVNAGFEESTYIDIGNRPSGYGYWGGDNAEVVGSENGINPLEGSSMLKFNYVYPDGPGTPGNTCDIYQIIDISPYAGIVAFGNASVTMSANFNRVAGDSQTDTLFYYYISAWEGNPSSYPTLEKYGTPLARREAGVYSDSDISTWENVEKTETVATIQSIF